MDEEDTWSSDDESRGWEDSYRAAAKDAIEALLDERAREVFYLKQLEVLLEKDYFHWVTAAAMKELVDEGRIGSVVEPMGPGTRVRFLFNRSHRYHRRQLGQYLDIIREYSQPRVAMGCGEQAEVLFTKALARRGFMPVDEDANEYGGRKWQETGHNLDLILERDGVAYGCEVKNTWDYIDSKELGVKLRICEHLGLVPLFIMRFSPKTYNRTIIEAGGFAVLFEAQIYPFGMDDLVARIRGVLRMPADSPRAIPSGIIDRIERLHRRKLP